MLRKRNNRKKQKTDSSRAEAAHRNAAHSVDDALLDFYNSSTTLNQKKDMSKESCLENIAKQTPTIDDQLRIYDMLMKMLGGAEPRNVCAVCCCAGPHDDFRTMKVQSRMGMLRADKVDEDVVPPFKNKPLKKLAFLYILQCTS